MNTGTASSRTLKYKMPAASPKLPSYAGVSASVYVPTSGWLRAYLPRVPRMLTKKLAKIV
jgi:hypothetical protein